jgi:hypothetical protein
MLDIRWYIEYITLLEILLLIIDFTDAPATEDKKLMFPGMTMVRALPPRFNGNDSHNNKASHRNDGCYNDSIFFLSDCPIGPA